MGQIEAGRQESWEVEGSRLKAEGIEIEKLRR
jgi:hypothetical protein